MAGTVRIKLFKVILAKLSRLKQPKNLIFIIIAFFVAIKLFIIFFRTHPLLWDEAVYLAIGKYIYSFGAVGLNESFRPFLLSSILGIFWKSGLNYNSYIMFSDLVLLIFSAACIYLVYKIGARYMNGALGLMSAVLLAFSPLFFYNSGRIMTEVPSVFFVLLTVFMFSKDKYWLSGLFCGIAFLFKFPSGIFAAAFLAAIILSYIKDRNLFLNLFKLVKFLISFSLCIFIYLILNYSFYGSFFEPLVLAAEHQSSGLYSVSGIWQNFIYYPIELLSQCFFFIFVAVAFAALFIKKDKNQSSVSISKSGIKKLDIRKGIIYFAFILPFIYFTIAGNKQIRFAMLYLPFLCLLSVYGFARTLEFIREKLTGSEKKKWLRRFFRLTSYAILLISFIYMAYYDCKSLSSFPKEDPAIVVEYNKFFLNYPKGILILTSDPIPAAYSDAKFIYFYDNLSNSQNRFRDNIDKVDYVIYNPNAIYCTDDVCDAAKDYYLATLNEKGTLIFNKSYNNRIKMIFKM
jgi:hypothetical protein